MDVLWTDHGEDRRSAGEMRMTMKMPISIRQESPRGHSAIKAINDLAFKQVNEGLLIEKLRGTPDFIPGLSLVAEFEQGVIGHILFYPVKIADHGKKFITLALGPMCVHPDHQRKGVGTKLVHEGLKRAKGLGYRSVIVVEHPEYYPRFGFKEASRFEIRAPFEVPDNAFCAIELVRGELKNKSGVVEYPQPYLDAV